MTLPTGTTPGTTDYTPATGDAKPTVSVWEDFVDIWYAPSQVFERRKNGDFGMAMAILTVLSVVLFLATKSLIAPAIDAEMSRQLAKMVAQNPGMDAAAARAQMDKFAGIGTLIFLGIGTPIIMLLTGVTLWLSGKLVDAKSALTPAIMVATYAYAPRVLGFILGGLQGLFMSPEQLNGAARLTLSPARFLDPDVASKLSIVLLSRLDVLVIWDTVLLAIGLSVIAKIPRSKAAVAAFVVWVLGALPALLQAR